MSGKNNSRKYIPRIHIGEALDKTGEWMTVKQINDELSKTRRTRLLLAGTNSISSCLRGANGLQIDRSVSPFRYRMKNVDEYRAWVGGMK